MIGIILSSYDEHAPYPRIADCIYWINGSMKKNVWDVIVDWGLLFAFGSELVFVV